METHATCRGAAETSGMLPAGLAGRACALFFQQIYADQASGRGCRRGANNYPAGQKTVWEVDPRR